MNCECFLKQLGVREAELVPHRAVSWAPGRNERATLEEEVPHIPAEGA